MPGSDFFMDGTDFCFFGAGCIWFLSAERANGFHAAFWFWPGFSGLSAESQAVWVESVQFLVRKAAHFFVYTVLGILLYWDFIPSCGSVRKKVGWVWAAGTAYAVSDEIHQLFVPGRSGQVRDVLLDSVGVAAGILLSWAMEILYKKAAAYAAAKRSEKRKSQR